MKREQRTGKWVEGYLVRFTIPNGRHHADSRECHLENRSMVAVSALRSMRG